MLNFTSCWFRGRRSRRPICASTITLALACVSLTGCGDSPAETSVAQNDAAPPSADMGMGMDPAGSTSGGSSMAPGGESGSGEFDPSAMSGDPGAGGSYPGAEGGAYPGGDGTDPSMTEYSGEGGEYPGSDPSLGETDPTLMTDYGTAPGENPGSDLSLAGTDPTSAKNYGAAPGEYPGSGPTGEPGLAGDPGATGLAGPIGAGAPGSESLAGASGSGTDPAQMQAGYGQAGAYPGTEGGLGSEGIPGADGGALGAEGYGAGGEGPGGGGGAAQAPPADSPDFPAFQLVMGLMQGKYDDMNKYVSARARGQLQKIGAGKLTDGEKADLKKTFAQPQLAAQPRNARGGRQIVLKSGEKMITIVVKKEASNWKVAELSIRAASRR